jgi:hypothetical protein
MLPLRVATRDHELGKYLQFLPVAVSDRAIHHKKPASFSFTLSEPSTLRDALIIHVDLLRFRLGMFSSAGRVPAK